MRPAGLRPTPRLTHRIEERMQRGTDFSKAEPT